MSVICREPFTLNVDTFFNLFQFVQTSLDRVDTRYMTEIEEAFDHDVTDLLFSTLLLGGKHQLSNSE